MTPFAPPSPSRAQPDPAGTPDSQGQLRWILRTVCEMFGWDVGQAWMLDTRTETLTLGASFLRSPEVEPLVAASRGLVLRVGEGLPGRCCAERRSIWVSDDSPAEMPRRPVAKECGLRNAFAVPVLAGERVLGVLEFASRQQRDPDQPLMDVVGAIAAEIGAGFEGRQHEQALLAAFRMTDVPICVLAHTRGAPFFRFANGAFARLTGYGSQELVGRKPTQLVAPTVDLALIGRMRDALARGLPFTCELPVRRRDGSELLTEWQVAPVFDEGGQPGQYVAIVRDASAREVVYRALAERNRELAVIDRLALLDANTVELSQLLGNAARVVGEVMGIAYVCVEATDVAVPLCQSCSGTRRSGVRTRGTYYAAGVATQPSQLLSRELRRDDEVVGVLQAGCPAGSEPPAWLSAVAGALANLLERYRGAVALRQSEEQREIALRSVSDVVWSVTVPDGRVLYVSPAVADVFDVSVEEVYAQGRTALEARVHPEDLERMRAAAAGLVRGLPFDIEQRIVRSDGEVRWVHCRAWANRCAEGKVVRVDGISRDITAQRRAEEVRTRLESSLQRAALEWRLTFDAVEVPIFILNAEHVVSRLNRAAQDLAGDSYAQLIGRRIDTLGSGAPWSEAARVASEARRGQPATAQVRDPDTARTWEISASQDWEPVLDEPRIILTARDITPIIRLQESLRRSETMSAMGTLVAGVAHEVRNPLFGISATLDAFEARFGKNHDFDEYTRVLRRELERMNDLMRELLEYGKPPGLNLALGSVAEPVALAVRACEALATKVRAQVVLDVVDEGHPVRMDTGRLSQVFANLLENALQHSPDQGTVKVLVRADARQERCCVTCEVLDGGAGFRAEDLPRIFEPFFTRRRGGTGLGLSIVQRIVEQHGGTIAAGNRPGGGGVVRVLLPCAEHARES